MERLHIGHSMRRNLFIIVALIIFICPSIGCATISEDQRSEYGILGSAVSASAYVVIGEYGDNIPADFNADKFMYLVKDKIPKDYYRALEKYSIDVRSKGSYYLLIVINPENKTIILFDYSCTPEADGPVLLEPDKYDISYDISKLELYDKCKAPK